MFLLDTREHLWRFGSGRVDGDVLRPGEGPSIGPKEIGRILGEMTTTEIIVVGSEEARSESLDVRLSLAVDRPSAPTAVDELPVTVVQFDGVPCVSGTIRRDGCLWSRHGRETVSFTVAAYDDALQSGVRG